MRKELCEVLKSSKNPQKKIIAMGMGDFQKIPLSFQLLFLTTLVTIFNGISLGVK